MKVTCTKCRNKYDPNESEYCPYCASVDFFIDCSQVAHMVADKHDDMLCMLCDRDLSLERSVDAYKNDSGWVVDGISNKVWLSIRCIRCNYDNSFDKFGIERV